VIGMFWMTFFFSGGEGFAGMEALSVGMEIGSGDVEEVGV